MLAPNSTVVFPKIRILLFMICRANRQRSRRRTYGINPTRWMPSHLVQKDSSTSFSTTRFLLWFRTSAPHWPFCTTEPNKLWRTVLLRMPSVPPTISELRITFVSVDAATSLKERHRNSSLRVSPRLNVCDSSKLGT